MKHYLFLLILAVFLLAWFGGCQLFESTSKPWVPVFEETNFDYFNEVTQHALASADDASKEIQAGRHDKADQKLRETLQFLLRMQRYYIPLTEVRQLVYDADRLFYLKKVDETRSKLKQARETMNQIGNMDGSGLAEPAEEVIKMIDELVFAIENSSDAVATHFGELGHRVNLMLIKGELILSEIEFK
jgi:hypothetical protein